MISADWGGLHEVSRLAGGDGDDTLHGLDGTDILVGGNGQDTLYGGEGHDWLVGGNGNDALFGGNGDDLMVGGPGDDYLDGGRGNNVLVGGEGHDTIVLGTVNQLDSIIAQDKGGRTDTIVLTGEINGRRAADPLNYWRDGADLYIRTLAGVWATESVYDPAQGGMVSQEVFYQSAEGRIAIKDFFLTRDAVDSIYYQGGGWSGPGFWRYFTPLNQITVFDTPHQEGGHRSTAIDGAEGDIRQPWTSIVSKFDSGNRFITQTLHWNDESVQIVNGDADNDIGAAPASASQHPRRRDFGALRPRPRSPRHCGQRPRQRHADARRPA